MTILELMQALSAFDADSIDMAAKAAVQSGIKGSRDIFMAWGADKNIPVSKLQAEWKAAQPEKAASGPRRFTDVYYDWLAQEARTEQEAHDLIMGDESQNVRNHLTHYLNIWALAETVRSGQKVSRTISAGKASPKASSSAEPKAKAKPKEPEWEYNSAAPYESVKAAWETLRREQASKRPRKTAVHPDKVSYLNDAELTTAYTKAFQTYSK